MVVRGGVGARRARSSPTSSACSTASSRCATGPQAAWSLIDVHLRRRHDLLPELASVVAAAAAHERAVHESVARAADRSRPAGQPARPARPRHARRRPRPSTPPTGPRPPRSWRWPRPTPTCRPRENYQRLAAEITETEDGIAFARGFYNDAINVMRDRRQRFPGLLLAPLVKVPSLELVGPTRDGTLLPRGARWCSALPWHCCWRSRAAPRAEAAPVQSPTTASGPPGAPSTRSTRPTR